MLLQLLGKPIWIITTSAFLLLSIKGWILMAWGILNGIEALIIKQEGR